MSRFTDKLHSLSKSSATPIGFRPSASELKSRAMLLIAGLSATQLKEAKIVANSADAGLILSENPSAKIIRQMVEALGDVPLGVFIKDTGQEKMSELASLGCDFVVFDIKAAAELLNKQKIGKFLMIEPSLDQGFVRAINSFEIDGVLIGGRDGEVFVDVEHLLVCRRFVELLEKPVMITLPSLVTKTALANLWQAGLDGVVAPPQSAEALGELEKMIGDLPRGARGRRTKVGVMLPHFGESTTEEDEEQEEEV